MPWMGAAIAGGVSVLGDVMSAQGQQQANQLNQAEMLQNEQWQTQMSNTAMQRRVADLKAAGLNPMLVVGTSGATVPGVSQPQMQNPSAAYANLGSQASSAIQLETQSAQIAQMQAQAQKAQADARNTDANTDQVLPAQVAQIKAQTGLTTNQASQVADAVQVLDYGIKTGISFGSQDLNYQSQAAALHISKMDAETQSATMAQLIKARNDVNYAAQIGASNIAGANDTAFGRIMAYFHLGQPAVSSAVGAAGAVSKFLP